MSLLIICLVPPYPCFLKLKRTDGARISSFTVSPQSSSLGMNTLGASVLCSSLASGSSRVTAGESLWKDLLGSHWWLSKGPPLLSSLSSMSLFAFLRQLPEAREVSRLGLESWAVAPLERFATWSPCVNVGCSRLLYGLIFASVPQMVRVRRPLAEGSPWLFSRASILCPGSLSPRRCTWCVRFQLSITLASWLAPGGYAEIACRIAGFISPSGRLVCLEAQIQYLLAGTPWQMGSDLWVGRSGALGKPTGLEVPAPQSHCDRSLVSKRDSCVIFLETIAPKSETAVKPLNYFVIQLSLCFTSSGFEVLKIWSSVLL